MCRVQLHPAKSSVLSATQKLVAHQRSQGYLSGSHLVAIGVHGGHDVDARVVDEPHDAVVPGPVLLTEELAELDEQLAAEHLIAVHVAHVLELGLHWRKESSVLAMGVG